MQLLMQLIPQIFISNQQFLSPELSLHQDNSILALLWFTASPVLSQHSQVARSSNNLLRMHSSIHNSSCFFSFHSINLVTLQPLSSMLLNWLLMFSTSRLQLFIPTKQLHSRPMPSTRTLTNLLGNLSKLNTQLQFPL